MHAAVVIGFLHALLHEFFREVGLIVHFEAPRAGALSDGRETRSFPVGFGDFFGQIHRRTNTQLDPGLRQIGFIDFIPAVRPRQIFGATLDIGLARFADPGSAHFNSIQLRFHGHAFSIAFPEVRISARARMAFLLARKPALPKSTPPTTRRKNRPMKPVLLALAFFTAASATLPAQPLPSEGYKPAIRVTPLLRSSVTSAEQPIAYPRTDQPEVTAVRVVIPPGAETGWHRHPFPCYGYILRGALTVEMEGREPHRLTAGQALIEAVDVLHNGRNDGSEPAELVMFVTGEKNHPFTVKAAAPAK